MISFSQAKDMFKLQRDAKRVRKELKNIHVEAEAGGVKVTVSGEMELVDVTIADSVPRESIPALFKDALNRAMKKAQVISAEKMQAIMGEMGLPVGGQGQG
jgi:DNA-binding protein YbaB